MPTRGLATNNACQKSRFSITSILGVCLISLVLNACDSNPKNNRDKDEFHVSDSAKTASSKDTLKTQNPAPTEEEMKWADHLIFWYLEENKDRLTEVDGHPVTFFQNRDIRDGRVYAMIQFGHSFEHRYQTDEWIFIDSISKQVYQYDLPKDSLIKWPQYPEIDSLTDSIPPSGVYEYDMAYAEHMGQSLGVKLTIDILGDSIRVIYNGVGSISAKIGTVLDEGILMRHKSGVWIVGHKPEDANTDEYGGCSDGPMIIDFKNKRFWMC